MLSAAYGNQQKAAPAGRMQYRFPLLRPADLVSLLEAYQIRLAESDITKPSANMMMKLFEAVASTVMGVQYARLAQAMDTEEVKANMEQIMDHPELQADSMPLMTFFRHLYVIRWVRMG